ncbi:hypothetical protein VST7929_00995 [Vibrio stylophorae]|uniref:Uncharacterized protein n=1 Tax=Vibrio stylophorae TaxID=659351 RepID=A0ABM8ZSN1_9VIBR|nr:hypothetical protein [Vibrio stylophorae]CAH0533134.1 hypothetical protein VST7929_00995 [Vibrio stylophorae]
MINKRDFLVLIDEEYGYRYWCWRPNMSAMALEAWWAALSSVEPYFMSPEPLPGEVWQIDVEQYEQQCERRAESQAYHLHLHQDDDSVLTRPDGQPRYHLGWEGC